jgi:hypothetical protein
MVLNVSKYAGWEFVWNIFDKLAQPVLWRGFSIVMMSLRHSWLLCCERFAEKSFFSRTIDTQ